MTTYSLNEVRALSVRAARGAGLAWGLAEEAGFAVHWLCWQGLPGAQALAARLAIDNNASQDSDCRDTEGVGRCPVCVGARISDRASLYRMAGETTEYRIVFPALLLPFLCNVSRRRNRTVSVQWSSRELIVDRHGLWCWRNGGLERAAPGDVVDSLESVAEADIVGGSERVAELDNFDGSGREVKPASIDESEREVKPGSINGSEREAKSDNIDGSERRAKPECIDVCDALEFADVRWSFLHASATTTAIPRRDDRAQTPPRVHIDASTLASLTACAQRTYAPATEESRRLGAGGAD